MNFTLTIDDQVVARAWEIARARGLSLNQLIQNQLELLTASDLTRTIEELEAIWEAESEVRETGRWKRDALYDRPPLLNSSDP